MKEVEARGTAAISLRDTAVALREVLADVPNTQENSHRFIHNYDRHLWEQVLDELPHRNVARLSIVSPFFEPNTVQPEDPIAELEVGIFERMFKDLTFEPPKGEKAVCVFFQQSEGKTLLPWIGCRPGTRTSNYTSGSPLLMSCGHCMESYSLLKAQKGMVVIHICLRYPDRQTSQAQHFYHALPMAIRKLRW